MSINLIDSAMLRKCFIAGARNLDRNKAYINELNVFPVPDGDTGTNMTMTVMSAAKAAEELDNPDITELCRTLSSGALRGARGNSGVIMSQLIRGFCKTVGGSGSIDASLASAACVRAIETAYKAVMKPKEGTILTVARGVAEKIEELAPVTPDLYELLEEAVAYGNEVLSRTPELLPVLKEAGVVDSGGQGLMSFLEGALDALGGRSAAEDEESTDSGIITLHPETADVRRAGALSTDDIRFGYCTEFIVNLGSPLDDDCLSDFRSFLESIGDSIVCVSDDDIVKVHVHTNHPGLAFEKGLEIGESLSRMKVDNMREEHEERLIKNASRIAAMEKLKTKEEPRKAPRKPSGFIAVCAGSGFRSIFEGLGASFVLEGGQTMNPSTDDILKAVEAANADEVYILPNNKNIILASEQAAEICQDVRIHVVPTKTIPQGIAAMINFTDGLSCEDNMAAMEEGIAAVRTGEVTYAVRNTIIDGMPIKEGDIMGIGDRGILATGEILNETAFDMIEKMADEDSSMITIYAGEGIDDESAGMLADQVSERYPELDVEVERGGQPVYYYIISVE